MKRGQRSPLRGKETAAGQQRRDRIVAFIAGFRASNGYSPSYDEITAAVGLKSKGHLSRYLRKLEGSGRMRVAAGRRARSLVPVGQS